MSDERTTIERAAAELQRAVQLRNLAQRPAESSDVVKALRAAMRYRAIMSRRHFFGPGVTAK